MRPRTPETLQSLAVEHGQGHLFTFWDELTAEQRGALLDDVARIDFEQIGRLSELKAPNAGPAPLPDQVEPVECLPDPWEPRAAREYDRARRRGLDLIRSGRVAAMTVAGGQGTRLGFDGPKGLFRISPVCRKSLFRLFAEGIRATGRAAGRSIPWYVMTSPANDAATRSYFEEQRYFGLPPRDVFFFEQGVMPALSVNGKILLAEKHRVALAPDGHGGSLTALAARGALADMADRGVESVSYFQVDNPLARPMDPLLVGLLDERGAQAAAVTISKAHDLERVGNFVRVGGRLAVIEYTELPETLAHARNPDGSRRFDAANLSILMFSRSFLEEVTSGAPGSGLPWHRAWKKVSHVDPATGARIEPGEPNAVKPERFVFDALPMSRRSFLLRSRRSECFSPVKNATGVDSAETARRDMSRRAATWLSACGIDVPRDDQGQPVHPCEISPLVAQDEHELAAALPDLELPPLLGPVYLGPRGQED